MNEQRRQILQMLADGKITADEAEKLLDALAREKPSVASPKHLRVEVTWEDPGGDGPGRINVRVPLKLLRAGVRLTSLIPPQAMSRVNAELGKAGVPIDLAQLKPQQLEELIEHLDDVSVDVDSTDGKVRVFCE
jgi:SHOCT-like protein